LRPRAHKEGVEKNKPDFPSRESPACFVDGKNNMEHFRRMANSALDSGVNSPQFDDLSRVCNLLTTMTNSDKLAWDREDKLNPIISNSRTLEQVLAGINRLIEIGEKSGDSHFEIINSY